LGLSSAQILLSHRLQKDGATHLLKPSTVFLSSADTKVSIFETFCTIENSPKLFVGQYLGDVWMYDFRELKYSAVKFTDGDNSSLLARSNHTSVFYKKHNR